MSDSKDHPFQILLYLEWVLLGIAVLAALSPLTHLQPPQPLPPGARKHLLSPGFPLAASASILALGCFGLRLPGNSRLWQILYTVLGFTLSWLAILLVGKGQNVFPPLLLVVVIRGCLLFPWSGRFIVALSAYASFLLMFIVSFSGIRPFGVPLLRPILPPGARRLPPEFQQSFLTNQILNSALLFALVLVFVVLLVGALLGEKQSRQKLTLANRRLRQYALLIENQATLQERNRIAREIHDSVGHFLTAQSIQLENVAMFLSQDSTQAEDYLQRARSLGKEALRNVRQSVATLRTNPLQGKTLEVALKDLAKEFEQTNQIPINLQITLHSSLSGEVTIALYRIVQEALTNISKHAQATQVWLKLEEKENIISLIIKDNGQGFNLEQNTTGFGLKGMRERTEALGGKFQTISKPGAGSKIQVAIPLLAE
ncbi:MAG: sensor histidine kinase [Spirulinaceae cyanobacterium]